MIVLDEFKKEWKAQPQRPLTEEHDPVSLRAIVKSRVQTHKKMAIQYSRINLLLQLLVYLLLIYVIVTYRFNPAIVAVSVAGLVLYIPFTISLYKRARKVVSGSFNGKSIDSLHSCILENHRALSRFYRFKKLSDALLTPLSCIIGTYLTFELFIPGGVQGNFYLALTAFIITLITCYASIVKENKEKFKAPLQQLEELKDEFSATYSIEES